MSLDRRLITSRRYAFQAVGLLTTMLVAGCGGLERAPSAPADVADQSSVLGIPNARFYADTQATAIAQEALRALDRERAALSPRGDLPGGLPPANLLALSGGSDDGAFGAGLLVGWTDSGRRPEFKLVSGVSTGSLIAPFAFLGSAYDAQLRAVYVGVTPGDIFEKRSLITAAFHESLADTTPLFRLISRYVDEAMLAAIAREYSKGRLLLIGTTNLDNRSFEHNDEVNIAFRDPEVAARIMRDLTADMARSREIERAAWRRRPSWEKLIGTVAWILERQQ